MRSPGLTAWVHCLVAHCRLSPEAPFRHITRYLALPRVCDGVIEGCQTLDRQIVYPGSIPLDTDILSVQRNTMVALGYLAQATLGQTTIADGLACVPTQPASMSVSVGPGSLTQFGVIDTTPFGSLPSSSAPLVRIGTILTSTAFTLAAPAATGQTISYLIQATLLETDATPIVLPYYNAANPGVPYSGPGGGGAAQMTQRLQTVELAVKAGPAVGAGAPVLPAVDAGWVGLYAVTVTFGQTAISGTDVTTLPSAPFVPHKLPVLSPGTRNMAVFQPTSQGVWSVPAGVTAVRLRIWGGGGAGGSGFGTAGGGGAGGGYTEGFYAVSPGQSFVVAVGNGGAASGGGGSSFGSVASAAGGQAGGNGVGGAGGAGSAVPGGGFGTGFSQAGGSGGDAFGAGSAWLSGAGGGSHCGAGGGSVAGQASASLNGRAGTSMGAGGSGGVGGGSGGQGGAGLVLIEW